MSSLPVHHRRSIRLPEYDYSSPGAYFITITTWNRETIFGKVSQGEMQLTTFGEVARIEWKRLESRFPQIKSDEFIVMPDHMHGIICILDTCFYNQPNPKTVEAGQESAIRPFMSSVAPPPSTNIAKPPMPPQKDELGTILRSYKSTTARLINGLRHTPGEPVWQRNYYEHIIRNEKDWEMCQGYIQNNLLNWGKDRDNPDFR